MNNLSLNGWSPITLRLRLWHIKEVCGAWCDDEGCVGEVRCCLSDKLDELFGVHAFEGEALMGCKRLSVHDEVCFE